MPIEKYFYILEPAKTWSLDTLVRRGGRSLQNPPLIDEPKVITHYNIPFDEENGSFTVGSSYKLGAETPRQGRALKPGFVQDTPSPKHKVLQNNRFGRGVNNFQPSPVDSVHLGKEETVWKKLENFSHQKNIS